MFHQIGHMHQDKMKKYKINRIRWNFIFVVRKLFRNIEPNF